MRSKRRKAPLFRARGVSLSGPGNELGNLREDRHQLLVAQLLEVPPRLLLLLVLGQQPAQYVVVLGLLCLRGLGLRDLGGLALLAGVRLLPVCVDQRLELLLLLLLGRREPPVGERKQALRRQAVRRVHAELRHQPLTGRHWGGGEW